MNLKEREEKWMGKIRQENTEIERKKYEKNK